MAFNELINGNSVIAVIQPMFIMTSVSVYLLLNGILVDLSSHMDEHYAFGLIPTLLCRHGLGVPFVGTYISNHVTTMTSAMRVRWHIRTIQRAVHMNVIVSKSHMNDYMIDYPGAIRNLRAINREVCSHSKAL